MEPLACACDESERGRDASSGSGEPRSRRRTCERSCLASSWSAAGSTSATREKPTGRRAGARGRGFDLARAFAARDRVRVRDDLVPDLDEALLHEVVVGGVDVVRLPRQPRRRRARNLLPRFSTRAQAAR
eukprot:3650060-Rhodomonas_salina.1